MQAGYHVLLFSAGGDEQEIEAYDEILATHRLDAFVLTSTHHGDRRTAWLSERDLPFVTFGRPWGSDARHSWVDVDGAAGTREVTANLVAAGHRRVAFVGWPHGSGVGDDRRAGWESAMAEAGLSPEGLSVLVDDGVDSGRTAAGGLLASAEPADRLRLCQRLARPRRPGHGARRRRRHRARPSRSSASTTRRSQRPSGSARSASR